MKAHQSATTAPDEDSRESEGKISTAGGLKMARRRGLQGADPRRSGMARRGGLQGADPWRKMKPRRCAGRRSAEVGTPATGIEQRSACDVDPRWPLQDPRRAD